MKLFFRLYLCFLADSLLIFPAFTRHSFLHSFLVCTLCDNLQKLMSASENRHIILQTQLYLGCSHRQMKLHLFCGNQTRLSICGGATAALSVGLGRGGERVPSFVRRPCVSDHSHRWDNRLISTTE